MTPEKLFHDLLGLGLSWEVTESCFEHERGTVVLQLRATSALWPGLHCPKCRGHAFCYDHPKELLCGISPSSSTAANSLAAGRAPGAAAAPTPGWCVPIGRDSPPISPRAM